MAGHPQAWTYLFLSPAGAPRFIDAWLPPAGFRVGLPAERLTGFAARISHLIGFTRRNILAVVGKIPNKMNAMLRRQGRL
jgi:hypothetical protein